MERNGNNGPKGPTGGKLQPTSIDVERLVDVPQYAVSRAFTEGASINPNPKTKEKVIAVARELGYQPRILPRILVTHRSQLIAIVIGGMSNPVLCAALRALHPRLPRARASGARLLRRAQRVFRRGNPADHALSGRRHYLLARHPVEGGGRRMRADAGPGGAAQRPSAEFLGFAGLVRQHRGRTPSGQAPLRPRLHGLRLYCRAQDPGQHRRADRLCRPAEGARRRGYRNRARRFPLRGRLHRGAGGPVAPRPTGCDLLRQRSHRDRRHRVRAAGIWPRRPARPEVRRLRRCRLLRLALPRTDHRAPERVGDGPLCGGPAPAALGRGAGKGKVAYSGTL